MKTALIVLVALASPYAAAQQAGNWELALTSMMTGQAKPAAVTQTRCFTEADARDPSRVLGGMQGTCTFTNKNLSPSTYTFDVACTGMLPIKGKGTVNYTATSLNADLDLVSEDGKFGMRTFVTGRHLGPC